jgi:hypothetical protein
MSLQNRAQQAGQAEERYQRSSAGTGTYETGKPSLTLTTGQQLVAIVDGELVNVIGGGDIPGMSPVFWCADDQGHPAPVSFREARIFTNAQQALQVLERERGLTQRQTAEPRR